MTAKEVLDFAKKHEAKQIDLRFTDIPGLAASRLVSDQPAEREPRSKTALASTDRASAAGPPSTRATCC